jgi:GNAT superfamily N-acetyltransferase
MLCRGPRQEEFAIGVYVKEVSVSPTLSVSQNNDSRMRPLWGGKGELEAYIRAGQITIRRAGPQEACAIAVLFQQMYRDSSHPFRSLALVAEFLADSRNFQIIAQEEDRIVASMAMTYQTWNNSYELGRALTVKEYRRNGLAGILMQEIVNWAALAGAGDIIFGYPRVARIAQLGITLNPQMPIVGHDAGRNVANGHRETHLISFGIFPDARFHHVRPTHLQISECPFMRDIYSRLGLTGSTGAYPPEYFVGAAQQSLLVAGSWTFAYTFGAPEGAVEVVARDLDGASAREMSEELREIMNAMPDIQHVTATILADKVDLIQILARQGFEVTAYLPAWYKSGPARYDCIQLSRRLYTGEPEAQDLRGWLHLLEAEFRKAPISQLREKEEI